MGQAVAVTEKPTSTPGVVRFELNRSLTGMGHERYRSLDEVEGERPPDVAARLLFETGAVDQVHIYSNVITADLSKGSTGGNLRDLIENFFIHYVPGVRPPTDEELTAEAG